MAGKRKRGKPGIRGLSPRVLGGRQPRTGVPSFRAVVGEAGYKEWLEEQAEQKRAREERIRSMTPEDRARAQAVDWWNSIGRFQRQ